MIVVLITVVAAVGCGLGMLFTAFLLAPRSSSVSRYQGLQRTRLEAARRNVGCTI